MSQTVVHEYCPTGAADALFDMTHPEILIEGPAGTGKTRAIAEYIDSVCMENPGVRILVLRNVRADLAESVLVTFEKEVWWPGHPCLVPERSREHRHSYIYPNGSEIVLGGLDKDTRLYSTQYDLVWVEEAIEISRESWDYLARCNRNNKRRAADGAPIQQRIASTNPGPEFHWLNRTFPPGRRTSPPPPHDGRVRLLSKHDDNPSLEESYLKILSSLEGVPRKRLFEGQWVAEEGQVWPMFDPAIHLIDESECPEFNYYFASMDFGYRNPGALWVWGVDKELRMVGVAEVYRVGKSLDWWADAVCDLHHEYGLSRVIADCAEPRSIDFLNDRLGPPGGREAERIVQGSDKGRGRLHGINQVRDQFKPDIDGIPGIRFVHNALRYGKDPILSEMMRPTCTVEEIPSYIFLKHKDGREDKEAPDPSCTDHGCDATVYGAVWHWRKDLTTLETIGGYAPGSLGDILGHSQKMARARRNY